MKKIFILLILSFFCFISACSNKVTSNKVIFFSEELGNYYEVKSAGFEKIEIPTDPKRDGYLFLGWYFDNETFQIEYDENFIIDSPLTNNVVIYAYWVSEKEYKIAQYKKELSECESDYNSAYSNYLYYSKLANNASEYYSYTQSYYTKCVQAANKKIKVYSGGSFTYQTDPKLEKERDNAKIEMDKAKELYDSYVKQRNNYEELLNLYIQKYTDLCKKITDLGGSID